MRLLVKNISKLFVTNQNPSKPLIGKELAKTTVLENSYLLLEDDIIIDYGNGNLPEADKIVDAEGKFVLPAFCDSHTHVVFAAPRTGEFVDRIKGLSYEEIAENGGGILNSAKLLRATSEEELYKSAAKRVEEVIRLGTGALEIKSGYGLDLDSELKMLRVVKKLKQNFPIPIKATFLGAHAFPPEYKNDRAKYIDIVCNDMLPKVVEEGLADYCDVFCDFGFFTPEESEIILTKAKSLGLKLKLHANELGLSGGVQVGAKMNAVSVDHLEFTEEEEIKALKNGNTIASLLPGTAFFLSLQYAPARKLIDEKVPVALATDYNPGSCPSGNMSFVMSLGCFKMKMLPEEALNAATINGAFAMNVEENYGSITKGKKANFIITKPMKSLAEIPYYFGSDLVEQVYINGKKYNS